MFFNSKLKKKIEELETKVFNLNRQLTRKERDNSVKDSQIKDLRDKIRFYENRKVTTDPNTPYNPRTDRYDSPSSYSSQYEDNNIFSTIAAASLLSESPSYNDSCSSNNSSSSYDSSSSCDSPSSYSD
jgi:septal ring factor EnvC (AmiA/AmiB activator)